MAEDMPTLRAATRRAYTAYADESLLEPNSFPTRVLFHLYIRCSMYFDIVVNGRNDRRRPPLQRDRAKEEELFAEDQFRQFAESDILRFMRLPTRWGNIRRDREFRRKQNEEQQHGNWTREESERQDEESEQGITYANRLHLPYGGEGFGDRTYYGNCAKCGQNMPAWRNCTSCQRFSNMTDCLSVCLNCEDEQHKRALQEEWCQDCDDSPTLPALEEERMDTEDWD